MASKRFTASEVLALLEAEDDCEGDNGQEVFTEGNLMTWMSQESSL